jgi:hypothetical protein
MSKKPTIDRGLSGGVALHSVEGLIQFLIDEADMDDDLTTVEYYKGMLEGISTNMVGEIHSPALEREIKAYGIQTDTDISTIARDDRSTRESGTDGD